jgi:hypothetical protein
VLKDEVNRVIHMAGLPDIVCVEESHKLAASPADAERATRTDASIGPLLVGYQLDARVSSGAPIGDLHAPITASVIDEDQFQSSPGLVEDTAYRFVQKWCCVLEGHDD